jgi:hypothetical protein
VSSVKHPFHGRRQIQLTQAALESGLAVQPRMRGLIFSVFVLRN